MTPIYSLEFTNVEGGHWKPHLPVVLKHRKTNWQLWSASQVSPKLGGLSWRWKIKITSQTRLPGQFSSMDQIWRGPDTNVGQFNKPALGQVGHLVESWEWSGLSGRTRFRGGSPVLLCFCNDQLTLRRQSKFYGQNVLTKLSFWGEREQYRVSSYLDLGALIPLMRNTWADSKQTRKVYVANSQLLREAIENLHCK